MREFKRIRTTTHATSTWSFVVAEEAKFGKVREAVRTNNMFNTLKARTKGAHTVCGGPTVKDLERFRKNRSANCTRDILNTNK